MNNQPTTTVAHSNVWVCTDCYFAHHYGAHQHDGQWFAGESDTPCEREPLALLAGDDLSDNTCSDHYYEQDCSKNEDGENTEPCAQCGSSDDENGMDDFSWSWCAGCGSTLGGSRYRLAVWFGKE